MTKNSSAQIIPFPLPPYLASYFANKITSESIICNDGSYAKPFNIKRNSPFGMFIMRCFSKQKRSAIREGVTFFIKVEEYKTTQSIKEVDARYSFIGLNDDTIKEIGKVFKAVFEESLKNYVAGAEEVTYKFTGRKRGIQKEAIESFCKKNKVKYTNQNLQSWIKMIYREKKRLNTSKTEVL